MIKLKKIVTEQSKPTLITEGMKEVNSQYSKLKSLKKSIESQYKEYQREVAKYDNLLSGVLDSELELLKKAINKTFTGKFTVKEIPYGFKLEVVGIIDNPEDDYFSFKGSKDGFGKEIRDIKKSLEANLNGAKINVTNASKWGHRAGTKYKFEDNAYAGSITVALTKGYRNSVTKAKNPPTINI